MDPAPSASGACSSARTCRTRSGHVDLLGWLLREASRLADAEAEAEAVGEAWGREEARKHLVSSALVGCDLATVLELWDWCGLDTLGVHPGWVSGGWRHVVAAALRSPRDWRQKAEWVVERATEMRQLALKPTVDLFEAALRPFPGHIPADSEERVAWLEGQGCRPDSSVLSSAVRAGDMAAFRMLRSRGVSLHSVISDVANFRGVITAAAQAGHLEMLQELRVQASRAAVGWGQHQWDAVLSSAASGGRLPILEWAGGCMTAGELRNIRREEVFRSAARSGSVAAMTWALEHGCTADEEAWSCAVESGCEAAVDFLTTLGCPQPVTGEPYEKALEGRGWRLLLALHWAGVSFGPRRSRLYGLALAGGAPPDVLRWLEREAGADPRAGAAEAKTLHACCEACEESAEQWAADERAQADEEVEAKADRDVEAEVERARRRHERGRWR
ncbi:hypothetical protein HYH03_002039 [Edaphochlamys debaryana]|uniref:Ankyrin repeat domain-containing protein n=1 Tax=Edaphochlamys debaryana TaxID=47281 RepID=A0A836C5V8_9CHLO|nr:hypothetical protein HYH03_002039 [Edaphochlamys debaryana]|eukprot:KAG2500473.1 hypothetical protein HYH03_002039 [Edaphochlamys debaryana]